MNSLSCSKSIYSPGGRLSIVTPIAGPWDSPNMEMLMLWFQNEDIVVLLSI